MKKAKKMILNCIAVMMLISCVSTTIPKVVQAAQREDVINFRIDSVRGTTVSSRRYTYKTLYFNKTFWRTSITHYKSEWKITYCDEWYKYNYKTQ